MTPRPRVLVVDDSAFARTVLSRILTAHDIDVVGTARDGDEALAQIGALDPDVVTLDLTMPGLDGLGVLRAIAGRTRPRVLVVSIASIDTDRAVEALALGAVDLVTKPTALASARLHDLTDELVAKVTAIAGGHTRTVPVPSIAPPAALPPRPLARAALIMIGTSTGGPQALTRIITGLPPGLAAPVAIALHIPAGYTEALAARLDKLTPLTVVEASDGLELRPGLVALARGGLHLRIERTGGQLVARLSPLPIRTFVPSVDELFASGAAAAAAGALGVVLTGMGDDGLAGARAIAAAGGSLLTEAEASCVVYGMPRCVFEAGLGADSVPLDQMALTIGKRA